MMKRLLIAAAALCWMASPAASQSAIPRSSPEAQGFSSAVLASAVDSLASDAIDIHSLLVARRDSLFLEAYFHPFGEGMLHDVASVTKSVLALLMFIAIDEGYVSGLDTPVLDLLPRAIPHAGSDAIRQLWDIRLWV